MKTVKELSNNKICAMISKTEEEVSDLSSLSSSTSELHEPSAEDKIMKGMRANAKEKYNSIKYSSRMKNANKWQCAVSTLMTMH